ncbi:MAG: phosphate acyltransferase PlsX [Gemmataceae bacterium]
MRIALDVMGADHGPQPIITGAIQALSAIPDLTVVLVGPQDIIQPHLDSATGLDRSRAVVHHCTQFIEMHEKPAEAFRRKPDNSIAHAWKLVSTKAVDGLVSPGNTGAVVAGGLFTKKFLKSVQRPGIATVMPTMRGKSVIMDVGANVFPKPRHLMEYAVMGRVYAQKVLGIENPKIGLMNVGEEEGKGHDLVQETYKLFRNSPFAAHFHGNIEGRDIHRGTVDVVVTDGFVGNVILKLSEGLFEFLMGVVGQEVIGSLNTEKPIAQAAVQKLLAKFHYSTTGGAPLLGVDGVCIICHGSSQERAIANALGAAAVHVRTQLNDTITAEIAALPAPESTSSSDTPKAIG